MNDLTKPKQTTDRQGFSTRAIHAGQSPDPSTGAIMQPIYATSTYVQSSPGVHKGYEYSRSQNPTRMAYERCVADLESGTAAFASGLAGTATVLDLFDSGAHVLCMDDLYGGTYRLFEKVFRRQGLDFTFMPSSDGSNQSIAVVPLLSILFGSTSTFSDFKSSAEVKVTSIGCCLGG